MVKYNIATPYTAVYMIFRKDDKIAFLLRSNTNWMNGHYGLPAGKVEKDESFTNAAIRETREEAGVELEPDNFRLVLTGHRKHPDSNWVDLVFEASNWEGEPHNAEPDIHGELVWLNPDNLPDNMVPYVKQYIEALQAGDNYCEHGWE